MEEKNLALQELGNLLGLEEIKELISQNSKYKFIYEAVRLIIPVGEICELNYQKIELFYSHLIKHSDRIEIENNKMIIFKDESIIELKQSNSYEVFITNAQNENKKVLFYIKCGPGLKYYNIILNNEINIRIFYSLLYTYNTTNRIKLEFEENKLGYMSNPNSNLTNHITNNTNLILALSMRIDELEKQITKK